MSVDIAADVELQSAIKELLALAGLPEPASLNAQSVQEAVNKLKTRLATSKTEAAASSSTFSAPDGGPAVHQNILVVGQLGIALHQVKHLLSPLCPNITLAKNIEGALISYQQERPSFIVIDIFMPTSREGFGLIQAIRQLAQKGNVQPAPQIVILSSINQEESLMENCHNQGIKHVLDRQDGWQQNILDIYRGAA